LQSLSEPQVVGSMCAQLIPDAAAHTNTSAHSATKGVEKLVRMVEE
jgi:hypothetical protein